MDVLTGSILQLAIEGGVVDEFSESNYLYMVVDCEYEGLITITDTEDGDMQLSITEKGRQLYAEAMQMYNPRPDIS